MARYEVFVKDGESRCLLDGREGPTDALSLMENGWSLVWDNAPSPFEGWTFAAVEHDALPIDYDDTYFPCLINEPTPLYRAVSMDEMSHILETGAVKGGGNGFNGLETRRFVFFASALSDMTISQGEDTERQAAKRLSAHPVVAEYDAAEKALDDFLLDILNKCQDRVYKMNEERAEEGWPLLMNEPGDWEEFRNRFSKKFSDTVMLLPESFKLFEKLSDLEDAVTDVQNRYLDLLRNYCDEVAREVASLSYSSAVIETVPISLGFHYSKSFGKSAFGDEDEFGLFPNQVKASDIVRVHWVKDGVVLRTTSLDEAPEIMEQIDRERAAHYGVRQPAMA